VAQLHSPRFVDFAPREIYATLLDEGQYLCSPRTMYRVLAAADELKERRNQLRHVAPRPELLATGPNEVWSWDITKLLGPAQWTYYYLYVLLDIFSRYVVGWMVAHAESARLAERLIAASCETQGIVPGQLTIHADRGTSMTSKTVALLLADLGVTRTHSRPHVSNDNPFSEAQFKTLKSRPSFRSASAARKTPAPSATPSVQHRASPRRHRLADPGDGALRAGGHRRRCAPTGPHGRLRGPSRALRAATASTAGGADRRLDQPAAVRRRAHTRLRRHSGHSPRDGRSATVNAGRWCLKVVDTFRPAIFATDGSSILTPDRPTDRRERRPCSAALMTIFIIG
jgi:transposase InsO family protein